MATEEIATTIVDNANATYEGGAVLETAHLSFKIPSPPPHTRVGTWGWFRGTVLAVAFPDRSGPNVYGSAVMVAPGLAIGALHVFEQSVEDVMAELAGAFCFGVREGQVDVWRIRHVTTGANTASDLAIYSLELASPFPADGRLFMSGTSTRTPAIGERLTIAGFRQADTQAHPELGDDGLPRVKVGLGLYLSSGDVTAQYPVGRDSAMLPFPCVEVECKTIGGMSGGPAFDADGRFVGILSSSMDGDGPSWVSLLWPALSWSVPGGWPAAIMTGNRSLLDLEPNRCEIDKRDAIVKIEGTTVEYVPWT